MVCVQNGYIAVFVPYFLNDPLTTDTDNEWNWKLEQNNEILFG